jgi:hypothetical protein
VNSCIERQADNAGDCKSRWNLAWAAWMVAAGFFEVVVLGFLLVGHTHEDVDQMFSRFSLALSSKWIRPLQSYFEATTFPYRLFAKQKLTSSLSNNSLSKWEKNMVVRP